MNKVAVIQMCSSENIQPNLEEAAHLIKKATLNGAKLIVLPEMFPIFGLTAIKKVEIAEPYGNGLIQNFLKEQSNKNKVWLVGGTIPIQSNTAHKIRAASLVYDDYGEVKGRYDKIHLFDVSLSETEKYTESDTVEAGHEITVIDTPIGRIGLAVCYDIRFPEMFRLMLKKNVNVFCIPSAFTYMTGKKHWEILCRARAIENTCFVLGACQGGLHTNGRRTFGHSMIVHPSGKIIKSLTDSSIGIISSIIDLEEQNRLRRSLPSIESIKLM